jgi:hypothetical protein
MAAASTADNVVSSEDSAEARSQSSGASQTELGQMLNLETMRPKGQRYEATVPDTLDLAERATLTVNSLTGFINPSHYYFGFTDVLLKKPVSTHPLTWNLPCEYIFALPMSRTMSGSEQNLEIEYGTMRSYLEGMAPDGIIYSPAEDVGKPKDTSFPDNSGFVGMAMMNWYERDGNPAWLDRLRMLVKGFDKIAIRVQDRAYFPTECCYLRSGTWYREGRGEPFMPYKIPEEPTRDYQGYEGAVKYYQSSPFQSALGVYRYTGDREALDLARALGRFLVKPSLWETGDPAQTVGEQIGIWDGHFHGNLIALWALMNLALIENDEWLKQVVRRGYEHARQYTVEGMGWSPLWHPVASYGRPKESSEFCDNCDVVDTIVLAIKLSDAGVGDYWDDVDAYARNQLAEAQFTDLEGLRRYTGNNPGNESLLQRTHGAFFQTRPTVLGGYGEEIPFVSGCCTGSGPWGMYYVWHGITRFQDGVATVNLFLNRASAWMDVDSYLPYEGKVVLHNKQARTAIVRIPNWVELNKLSYSINDRSVKPVVSGRRAVFQGLSPNDAITLEFPVTERTEKRTVLGKEYSLTFRGSTIVDVSPKVTDPDKYPMYQRAHMRTSKTPQIKVTRFVPDKLIPLV